MAGYAGDYVAFQRVQPGTGALLGSRTIVQAAARKNIAALTYNANTGRMLLTWSGIFGGVPAIWGTLIGPTGAPETAVAPVSQFYGYDTNDLKSQRCDGILHRHQPGGVPERRLEISRTVCLWAASSQPILVAPEGCLTVGLRCRAATNG